MYSIWEIYYLPERQAQREYQFYVKLFNADGKAKIVDIYTKFNIIDLPTGSRTIVISFHKRNKPVDYLFR